MLNMRILLLKSESFLQYCPSQNLHGTSEHAHGDDAGDDDKGGDNDNDVYHGGCACSTTCRKAAIV